MKGIGTISESALWRVILNVESRLMPDLVMVPDMLSGWKER